MTGKEVWKRIDEKKGDMSVKELSELTGIKYQLLKDQRSRDIIPKAVDLASIARALNTTMDYVMTGRNFRSAFLEYIPYLEKASDGDLSAIRKILGMPEKILNSGKIIV